MTLWNKHAQHQTWIPHCICNCTLCEHRCQWCVVFEPSNHPSSHSPTFEAFEIFTTFTPKTTRRFTPRYTYLGWVNGFGEKGEANVKQLTLTMISGLKINEKVPGFWKNMFGHSETSSWWSDSVSKSRFNCSNVWLWQSDYARETKHMQKNFIYDSGCIYISLYLYMLFLNCRNGGNVSLYSKTFIYEVNTFDIYMYIYIESKSNAK